jgi:hypothetical protein
VVREGVQLRGKKYLAGPAGIVGHEPGLCRYRGARRRIALRLMLGRAGAMGAKNRQSPAKLRHYRELRPLPRSAVLARLCVEPVLALQRDPHGFVSRVPGADSRRENRVMRDGDPNERLVFEQVRVVNVAAGALRCLIGNRRVWLPREHIKGALWCRGDIGRLLLRRWIAIARDLTFPAPVVLLRCRPICAPPPHRLRLLRAVRANGY